MDYQRIIEEIAGEVKPLLTQGKIADYIPELAKVSPTKFGMAVRTAGGELFTVGDASERFSIQSISKLFTLTLAMIHAGDKLWERTGREASGSAFNSLVQLEYENGVPRNPFINAGALVVTDVIISRLSNAKQSVMDFVRGLCGKKDIKFDLTVAQSESRTGHRNKALAHFLKSFGNLHNDTDEVLDAYFHHCSIAMSCVELADACMYLVKDGINPINQSRITTESQAKYINSLMLTCGTYDDVGDFAYRVGLPGKSGVGGGIVAVMPDEFAVCVWSPGLNESGNSLAGVKALELFTTKTGISIF
ncbi:MAG: glutaminase [Candidatus Zixiibacteriota bacterium]